ncbi:hypothetical protein [Microbacterium sp.]|uniref:hypothetical protein n=1 Tax=Microbacterium sp. TaxID=51671 RepID=UPI003C73FCC0
MSTVRSRVLPAVVLVVAAGLVTVVIVLPFLPGEHDPLARAASTALQLIGIASLLLVPLGLGWIAHEVVVAARMARGHQVTLRRRGLTLALLGSLVGLLAILVLAGVATGALVLAIVAAVAAVGATAAMVVARRRPV